MVTRYEFVWDNRQTCSIDSGHTSVSCLVDLSVSEEQKEKFALAYPPLSQEMKKVDHSKIIELEAKNAILDDCLGGIEAMRALILVKDEEHLLSLDLYWTKLFEMASVETNFFHFLWNKPECGCEGFSPMNILSSHFLQFDGPDASYASSFVFRKALTYRDIFFDNYMRVKYGHTADCNNKHMFREATHFPEVAIFHVSDFATQEKLHKKANAKVYIEYQKKAKKDRVKLPSCMESEFEFDEPSTGKKIRYRLYCAMYCNDRHFKTRFFSIYEDDKFYYDYDGLENQGKLMPVKINNNSSSQRSHNLDFNGSKYSATCVMYLKCEASMSESR
jgi:hypothetical protein